MSKECSIEREESLKETIESNGNDYRSNRITFINSEYPLTVLHRLPPENGPVIGMALSDECQDGASLLAIFTYQGVVKIYDLLTYRLLRSIRDEAVRKTLFIILSFILGRKY